MSMVICPSDLALHVRGGVDFESSDADEIRIALTRQVAPHHLQPARAGGLAAQHIRLGIGSLTLFQVGYGAEVHIEADGCGPNYLVKVPVRGRARVTSNNQAVDTSDATGAILNPDVPLAFHYDADCAQLVLALDASRLERHCAALLGDAAEAMPLDFRLGLDLGGPEGQRWLQLTSYVMREAFAADENLPRSALVTAPLEQMVMTTLLATQPHRFTDALLRPVSPAVPRAVARAIDYIDAHLGDPLTPLEIASAAGVSERALFRAFRDFRGESPMAYLQRRRLERVHAELRHGAPEAMTITEVALRWGFMHLGRFGQVYRRRFGETPTESLHRG